ncbi:helix-turn-helix domain-containing protein [Haloglomus irregulare]|jgi:transposase|uniref:Helix-turn-helix domain-containing protein n=1 Tax=Haloglomus irregulare TaxID=2234134 RepID=A0A554MVS0_9EURY|nr:helix-turn-helix domain-containing protein [Haloglomus irregulare]TSD08900.1 helix-turn-helix domain-containing protein [Haloglomus irregulare]
MTKLGSVPLEELHAELESVESAKGAKRLMVAIAYKDGVDVETIAARYAIPQSTIYYWLDRLDKEPLSEALEDDNRPGRPSKLSPEQRATVADWVDKDAATGSPERNWTARELRDKIVKEFGVEYSIAHVNRTFLG